MGVEPSKDLQRKLEQWNKRNPINKQLETLEDIAAMLQELASMMVVSSKKSHLFRKDLAPLVLDMRESLKSLKDKDLNVDMTPIEAGLKSLEGALKQLEVKPVFKPDFKPVIKVEPNIDLPDLPELDLSPLEALLRSELPKIFTTALSEIPQTELETQPLLDKYDEMIELLKSVDQVSRLKPAFPETMKVTTSTALTVEEEDYDVAWKNDSSDSNIKYFGRAVPGTATSSASWQIAKVDMSDGGLKRFANGDPSFSYVWDNRESLSY